MLSKCRELARPYLADAHDPVQASRSPHPKEAFTTNSGKKWSAEVTAHDHPFDLEPGLFANGSAQQIAAALKKSAEDPARGSDDPYRTAMSMLDFYINRAGAKLSAEQSAKLDQVKPLLKQSFGR
jgi:hypothetical protein